MSGGSDISRSRRHYSATYLVDHSGLVAKIKNFDICQDLNTNQSMPLNTYVSTYLLLLLAHFNLHSTTTLIRHVITLYLSPYLILPKGNLRSGGDMVISQQTPPTIWSTRAQ